MSHITVLKALRGPTVFQVNLLYLKRICPQWVILLVDHPKVIPNSILDMFKKKKTNRFPNPPCSDGWLCDVILPNVRGDLLRDFQERYFLLLREERPDPAPCFLPLSMVELPSCD